MHAWWNDLGTVHAWWNDLGTVHAWWNDLGTVHAWWNDLGTVKQNYYKIIITKKCKISRFSHRLCAVNGKVDTEKQK